MMVMHSIVISICFLLTCWLVLDPVFKLGYLNAAWEPQYLDVGMKQFKAQVSPHWLLSPLIIDLF